METFVSMDFETAMSARNSACAIAIVKVTGNVITQRFYSLIKPPQNEYSEYNISVHGITPTHTENAPTFFELYPTIKQFIHGNLVVCHNANFDTDVLMKTMLHHEIDPFDIEFNVADTCILFGGRGLNDCCLEHNIPLNHHDALSDAEACAKLFLISEGKPVNMFTLREPKANKPIYPGHKKIGGQALKPNFVTVSDKDNVFFGKKVVITGVFEKWPDRSEIAVILHELGADVDGGVTARTNILVAGMDAGPKKIEKMQANKASGKEADIINESQLIELLDEINNRLPF